MDIRQLEYIIEIAKEHNITRAAKNLYVSQPTLSLYLAKLEQELGTPLFTRLRNELVLTAAGEDYVEAARQVIRIRQELYQKIAAKSAGIRISLGVSSQWGMDMLARVLPQLCSACPEAVLDVTEGSAGELVEQLSQEKLDFVIASVGGPLRFPCKAETLYEEELILAVPEEWALRFGEDPITEGRQALRRLNGASFVLPKKGTSIRTVCEELFSECGIHPNISCEINRMAGAVKLTAGGAGASILPVSRAEEGLSVRYLPFSPAVHRCHALLYRENRSLNRAEQQLIRLMKQWNA